jgi:hypothetical protein
MKLAIIIIFLLTVTASNAQNKTRAYFGLDNYTYTQSGRLTLNTIDVGVGAQFFNALSVRALYGKNFSNGKSKGLTKEESLTFDLIGINTSIRIPNKDRKLSVAFGLTLNYLLANFNPYRITGLNSLQPYTNENLSGYFYLEDLSFQTITDLMLSYRLEHWEFKAGVALSFLRADGYEQYTSTSIVNMNWTSGGYGVKVGLNYIL